MRLKFLYFVLWFLLCVPLAWVNVRLYSNPELSPADTLPPLRNLRTQLHNGAATRMQGFVREGYFLTNAVYALAWGVAGENFPQNSSERREALKNARHGLAQLDNRASTSGFDIKAKVPYGVCHRGWSLLVRAQILALVPPDGRDEEEVLKFRNDCAELARAFESAPSPYLESYPGTAFPIDNVAAIAALKRHDRLFEPRYEKLTAGWIQKVRLLTDPQTGLLPRTADPQSGRSIDGPHAVSQTLTLLFLPEINPEFAAEQYRLFRSRFTARRWGIPVVLSYPADAVLPAKALADARADILGASCPALFLMPGTAKRNNDDELFKAFSKVREAFGFTVGFGTEKRYLLGAFPLADAFILLEQNLRAPQSESVPDLYRALPDNWQMPFHLISGGILFILLILGLSIFRNRRPKLQPGVPSSPFQTGTTSLPPVKDEPSPSTPPPVVPEQSQPLFKRK